MAFSMQSSASTPRPAAERLSDRNRWASALFGSMATARQPAAMESSPRFRHNWTQQSTACPYGICGARSVAARACSKACSRQAGLVSQQHRPLVRQGPGEPGMSQAVAGIQLHRLCKQRQRLRGALLAVRPEAFQATQQTVVGLEARRSPVAEKGLLLEGSQPHPQDGNDAADDGVLHGKDFLQLALVPLRPQGGAGCRVDELSADAHLFRGSLDAALDEVTDAQLPRDLLGALRHALVRERGMAGDDDQTGEPGELGRQVLGDAVGEILLCRVRTQVEERQHDHGRPSSTLGGGVADLRVALPPSATPGRRSARAVGPASSA